MFYDRIDSIRHNYIRVTYYETADDAMSGMRGSPNIFVLCPFDPKKRDAAITNEISKLGTEDRNKIAYPDREPLTSPAAAEIMSIVGLGDKSQ